MNKGIVATGSKEATQAAADILREGGNAIDAAISAVFTSMTSEFALTGAAGGGAMMIKTPNSMPILYDFFVDTPTYSLKKEIDFFRAKVDFGNSTQYFHIGKGSVAIPGNLAGLFTAHQKFGKLPLSVILEPGIHLSRSGYRLNKEQAYIFKILEPIFCHSLEARNLLGKDNRPLKEGELFVNTDFSNFLETVAKDGINFFYQGELAELISATLNDGGLIDIKSLKKYKVIPRKPVSTSFKGTRVYSNPPPSAGGSLIIFLLRLLENNGQNLFSLSSLLSAMSCTNTARSEICSDPNDESQYFRLLEDEIFTQYLDGFSSGESTANETGKLPDRGCTTQVSVLDKGGNCASVTTSNGEGSGYILPGTGIMLNNMLGEEDLNPQGFHNWTHSRRLATMMSPSIITKDGQPMMIIGSGGSNRIRSAIVQVLINYICKDEPLAESIENPRIHLEGNKLYYEPGIDISISDHFDQISLHPFDKKNLFFGGVNAVTLTDGASDSRRGGSFEIV